jgi:hypothetical protein
MTLVLSTLGQLIQTQFGVNELASAVVIGKAIGSLITRKSDASVFLPLEREYGLFVRDIPKYLQSINFDRSGTILGDRQRRIPVENTLEGVKLDSVEGIATFMVLILRHVEAPADIVEYLEDLLRGKFRLVGRARSDEATNDSLPYSLREILQAFVSAVIDADADSPQTNRLRQLAAQVVFAVGNGKFMQSVTRPSQHEQERFLSHLLAPNPSHQQENETFHTLSAGATMIALAAAANGANIRVLCMTHDKGTVVLSESDSMSHRSFGRRLEVILWLVQPPPEVAEQLRAISHRDDFEPRTTFSGMLPILGGIAEVSSIVSQQIECECSHDEILEFWVKGLSAGGSCTWNSRVEIRESRPTLVCFIEERSLLTECEMPASLLRLASRHFKAPRNDILHKLAEKAASILHATLQYSIYDGVGTERLDLALDFIIIAFFVGCMGRLASNTSARLRAYAWTADVGQFRGFAEAAVSQGLTINRIVLVAARIWGGLTPSFSPEVGNGQMLMGIACPRTTILLNILSRPEEIALYGFDKGLFTLNQGSIPLIPRDQYSGLVFAGTPRFRKPVQNLDAGCQIPAEEPVEQRLIFTLEPATGENGILAVLLCAWQYGDVVLEFNPYHALRGLAGRRSISKPNTTPELVSINPKGTRFNLSHMGDRELLSLSNSFIVRNGIMLIRAGSRVDLQIVAAGNHAGPHTLMITTEDDAAYIRNAQQIQDSVPKICTLYTGDDNMDIKDGMVIIFCRDDLPPHLGETITSFEEPWLVMTEETPPTEVPN